MCEKFSVELVYTKRCMKKFSVKFSVHLKFIERTRKRVPRTSLLNILQNEDDYIQIPVIMKKVGEVE